jgi:large subunit ribosomal protein L28
MSGLSVSSLTSTFRSLSLKASLRCFSTTPQVQRINKLPEEVPPYPYGPNYVYRQANFGLYGGAQIQFGNKISKGRNKGKTRRSWKPNVRRKKIHSDALDKDLFIKVTRKSLRTIRKVGGLDKYLLEDRPGRVKELGTFGWHLRWQIMQTPKYQALFKSQRKRLGLPEPPSFEEWLERRRAEEPEEAFSKEDAVVKHEQTRGFKLPLIL